MPGHSPPAHVPQRRFGRRILGYAPHVILNTLMSLAVVVFERRIRKALRSNAGPGRRTSHVRAGTSALQPDGSEEPAGLLGLHHLVQPGHGALRVPGSQRLVQEFLQVPVRAVPAAEDEREDDGGRAGITMERVYLQTNPDGSKLFVIYVEAVGDAPDVIGTFATSGSDFDQWFLDVNQEITGIDFRQPASGGGPEQLASWADPGGGRGTGLAFALPLLPGKAGALRAWAREAFDTRRRELTESRLALGQTREEVFLNSSPAGEVAVAYLEGKDPIRANREFAASAAPYDRWFKDRLREIFPPFIDFDQPVPANQTVWDWTRD
jgi:hypothetical protein